MTTTNTNTCHYHDYSTTVVLTNTFDPIAMNSTINTNSSIYITTITITTTAMTSTPIYPFINPIFISPFYIGSQKSKVQGRVDPGVNPSSTHNHTTNHT